MRILGFLLFCFFVPLCSAYNEDIVSIDVVKIEGSQATIRINNRSGAGIKLTSTYTLYEFSKQITSERVRYSWIETARGDYGPKNHLMILARGESVEFTVPISREKGTKVAISAADMSKGHRGNYSSFSLIICPPMNGLD